MLNIDTQVSVSSGMMALADYVSSPSSTGSWMFYDLPEMLISTGGRTQTQTQRDSEDGGVEYSTRLMWLKKPSKYIYLY